MFDNKFAGITAATMALLLFCHHAKASPNYTFSSTVMADTSLGNQGRADTIAEASPKNNDLHSLSAAPVPDDDIDAPTSGTSDLEATSIRPDFFARPQRSAGDGFATGSQVSENRRGHAAAAAGLALAVPLTQ